MYSCVCERACASCRALAGGVVQAAGISARERAGWWWWGVGSEREREREGWPSATQPPPSYLLPFHTRAHTHRTNYASCTHRGGAALLRRRPPLCPHPLPRHQQAAEEQADGARVCSGQPGAGHACGGAFSAFLHTAEVCVCVRACTCVCVSTTPHVCASLAVRVLEGGGGLPIT